MILEVLKFPDPRLRESSEVVKDFTAELRTLSENMLATMYAENGIGLAAPQVGELIRMLVIDSRPRGGGEDDESKKKRYDIESQTDLEKAVTQPLVIINPRVVKSEGKTTFEEGCLSVPTFFETVERARWISLEYNDLNGKKCRLETDGLLAIVVQHEMDHLDGTLFIDHLSMLKSNKIKNQIKKHGYPKKEEQPEPASGRGL